MRYRVCPDTDEALWRMPAGIRIYDRYGQAYKTTGILNDPIYMLDERNESIRSPIANHVIYEDMSNVCYVGVI